MLALAEEVRARPGSELSRHEVCDVTISISLFTYLGAFFQASWPVRWPPGSGKIDLTFARRLAGAVRRSSSGSRQREADYDDDSCASWKLAREN